MPATRPSPSNGRADRIREYLGKATRALTARELLDAVDPGGDISNMHGSQGALVRFGHVMRQVVEGRPRFWLAGNDLARAANDDAAMTDSARIRQYMATAGRPVTSREITDQVLPNKGIRIVSAMLGGMTNNGLVLRNGPASERVYTLGRTPKAWGAPSHPKKARPPVAVARAPKPPSAPKRAVAKKTVPPAKPATPSVLRRVVRGPELTIRDVTRGLATADPPTPAPRSRRASPPSCAMHGIPDTNRAASDRIARDIDAFLATGGVIERLGVTKLFHHPADNDDE